MSHDPIAATKPELDVSQFMTQKVNDPSKRRHINLAITDSLDNLLSNEAVCRTGKVVDLITYLNDGLQAPYTVPEELGEDEAAHAQVKEQNSQWLFDSQQMRIQAISASFRSDTTFVLVIQNEQMLEQLRQFADWADPVSFQDFVTRFLDLADIPRMINFITYCTYVRVDDRTHVTRHKTCPTGQV